MSSFSLVLVEQGVEVEVPGDLSSVISLLDEEAPWFSHNGHEYQLTAVRTQLRERWELTIRLISSVRRNATHPAIGRIEVDRLDNDEVRFAIPPRDRESPSEYHEVDPEGHFLGSFMFQTLNMLQRRGLITLPGVLPTF